MKQLSRIECSSMEQVNDWIYNHITDKTDIINIQTTRLGSYYIYCWEDKGKDFLRLYENENL